MHRCCAQLARSTRRVYGRDVAYIGSNAPLRIHLQTRLSTSSASPSESAPPTPRKSGKITALLLTTLALAAAATTYHLSSSSSAPSSTLHDRIFTPYTITSKTPISPTSTIFTLSPPSPSPPHDPKNADPFAPLWPKIWSLTFKQPQLQVARSYTPLPPPPPNSPLSPGALRFLIRREPGGEVSTYLSHLPIGATISVRGPTVEYAFPPDVSDVVFLAGGTGIAPAMQAVRAVLGEDGEGGKDRTVKILWANRRREECAGAPVSAPWWRVWGAQQGPSEPPSPLVEELRGLEARYGGRVEVRYFIDAEGSFIDRRGILDAVKSARGEEKRGKKLIMVAGPEGFVKHYVGARVWEGGEEKQGPFGGVVKGLGLGGWEVVKL